MKVDVKVDIQEHLIQTWQRIGSQMDALLQGIPDARMTDQPGGLLNHPAWTLCHLCHYHPAILNLLHGKPVADPAHAADADRYDEGSTPVADAARYPSRELLVNRYHDGHRHILAAASETSGVVLAKPPGLARWASGFSTTADVLMYLMVMHESQHAGQIMSWRRAAGLSLA